MKVIALEGRCFQEFISVQEIDACVSQMAKSIDVHYQNKDMLLLGILNGSFMIVSDMVKKMTLDPEISFVKIASYQGMNSTGEMRDLIGLHDDIKGRHVLIVEDIVDTGNTLKHIFDLLVNKGAATVKIATLFHKPTAYKQSISLDFVGKEIEDRFVVGYGMDLNGHGRNLSSLYQLCPE